jgi:hypothetical protein
MRGCWVAVASREHVLAAARRLRFTVLINALHKLANETFKLNKNGLCGVTGVVGLNMQQRIGIYLAA